VENKKDVPNKVVYTGEKFDLVEVGDFKCWKKKCIVKFDLVGKAKLVMSEHNKGLKEKKSLA